MSYIQVSTSLKTFPLTRKEIEKGVKDVIRYTNPHLTSRITSELVKQTQGFLEGYWLSFSKELQEPYNKEELSTHFIKIGVEYVIVKLQG